MRIRYKQESSTDEEILNNLIAEENWEARLLPNSFFKRKSTTDCANNKSCRFNHSELSHAVMQTLLCDNPTAESKGAFAMSELNIRELKGIDIANRYTILFSDGVWTVPSSSGKSDRYKITLNPNRCTCPDFEIRRQKCKHIFAVEFAHEQAEKVKQEKLKAYVKPALKRKTYGQVWTAYNNAQRRKRRGRNKRRAPRHL